MKAEFGIEKGEWKSVTLGDLVEPAKTWNPTSSPPDEVFDYIDLSAINQDTKVITQAREVLCSEAPSRARQVVARGDVLVSTVRPNLNGVARVPDELDGATASTGFCVLRGRQSRVDGAYLFHWVKSPAFVADMINKATGASYPAVSDRIIFDSRIPLPRLAEQRRIAELLDRAEALRAKRRAALAELDYLTQSIFLEMFGDSPESKNLREVRLSEVTTRITDGTHLTPKFVESGVPFIFVKNVRNGSINFETDKFISNEEHAALYKRCPVETGDVLYTTVGATYGQAASVGHFTKFAFQRHLAHLKPDTQKIEPSFLGTIMQLPLIKRQADRWARGVAQPTINLKELREFIIPLPVLESQREFARRVAAVEKLKAAQRASLAELDALFASLQHRAFKGEL